jgi:SAM-dependent methyltransferase
MPDTILRPDNYEQWDPRWFEKADASSDAGFYVAPRKVVHIDDTAIAAVTQLYRELLPANGAILDLMSSWRSHLPKDVKYSRVAGLGMNAEELRDNPQLTEHATQNLNVNPALPYGDNDFDAAVCCVSVQYLQKPVEVFREVGRVLKAGAPFIVTFSNRCFPTKAVNLWRSTSDEEHMQLVAIYFQAAGGWGNITMQDRSKKRAFGLQSDPLYAVWAYASQQHAGA